MLDYVMLYFESSAQTHSVPNGVGARDRPAAYQQAIAVIQS